MPEGSANGCNVTPRQHVIGYRWVFVTKLDNLGNVKKLKARLVAKGYNQRQGTDYFETFAPALYYKSLRIILAIVATQDYELKQMDVPTAFLNATLADVVYMELPTGFVVPPHLADVDRSQLVVRLLKSLYGIKQAPREWHLELNSSITDLGYVRCDADSCVYVKKSKTDRMIIVPVFVDDMFPACHTDDLAEMNADMQVLRDKYQIDEMEDADVILGMRIKRDRAKRILSIDQEIYTTRLVQKYGMHTSKSAAFPEATKVTNPSPGDLEVGTYPLFNSLTGELMYTALSTRGDIAHATAMIARSLKCPTKAAWTAAKRILRYLHGTQQRKLIYGGRSDGTVTIDPAFCDADCAGDLGDRKSTSGYILYVSGCAVSWASKKQTTVSLSSAESEYCAMSVASQEILWMRTLLGELGFPQPTTVLQCDNQPAIAIAQNLVTLGRIKHIDIKHHFIRQHILECALKVQWTPSLENVADIFTKALGQQAFDRLVGKVMGEQPF